MRQRLSPGRRLRARLAIGVAIAPLLAGCSGSSGGSGDFGQNFDKPGAQAAPPKGAQPDVANPYEQRRRDKTEVEKPAGKAGRGGRR